jgi:hypothetical protein
MKSSDALATALFFELTVEIIKIMGKKFRKRNPRENLIFYLTSH